MNAWIAEMCWRGAAMPGARESGHITVIATIEAHHLPGVGIAPLASGWPLAIGRLIAKAVWDTSAPHRHGAFADAVREFVVVL